MSEDGSGQDRPRLEALADAVVESYRAEPRTQHIGQGPLPSRYRAIELIELIRDLFFPGYFADRTLTDANVYDHAVGLLAVIRESLEEQIDQALCYQRHTVGEGCEGPAESTRAAAQRITDRFLQGVPDLRALLALDVQAAFDGDPAAVNTDQAIFCYPGIDAVFTYRVAHELHNLGVPMLPRILTEYVHNETGIDIHPAAQIGESLFIDHGTGVVIGETTVIGRRVKLYQGVTLGAMSFPRDESGRLIRGTKRHPTLEDDVTVYANATILGGETIIGRGTIVGGSVFLTKSVPSEHYVTLKTQELKYRSAEVHDRLAVQAGREAQRTVSEEEG